MKLQTTITPRADGTVIVHGEGKDFVFAPNDEGICECDVDDEALVVQLVSSGNYHPADAADFDSVMDLINQNQSAGQDDDQGDDQGEFGNTDALPLESNTPPVTFRKPGLKKSKK